MREHCQFVPAPVTYRVAPVWGLGMTAFAERTPYPEFGWLFLKSFFGAFILRSAACTVNDIFDRKFDAAVGKYSWSVS